mgnify:CR=1 FL=1
MTIRKLKNLFFILSKKYNTISIIDGDKPGRKLANYSNSAIYLNDGEYLDEMNYQNINSSNVTGKVQPSAVLL